MWSASRAVRRLCLRCGVAWTAPCGDKLGVAFRREDDPFCRTSSVLDVDQQVNDLGSQGDRVGAAILHAVWGDGPGRGVEIDFFPSRSPSLLASGDGEDEEK